MPIEGKLIYTYLSNAVSDGVKIKGAIAIKVIAPVNLQLRPGPFCVAA